MSTSSSSTNAPGLPAEEVLWQGTPSQWQNFWWWISCLLVVPIPIALWKAIVLKNTEITLTNQRLKVRSGVFSKAIEEVELYRVKDWALKEPFIQRILGRGTIQMETSDRTAPQVELSWVEKAHEVGDKLRHAVEAARDRKRVREVDAVDEAGGSVA
jgi:uncharacterized membrane protein YdbT with pleckstrin-like domain